MKVILILSMAILATSATPTVIRPVQVEEARTLRGMRIVGGFQAGNGQFPHHTRILAPVASGTYQVCGGTVIGEMHVLTAAHCTAGLNDFRCGFGSNDLENPQIAITSSSKLEHPNYNPVSLNNDIAIITLPQRLSFTNLISPALLPRLSQQSNNWVNERVIVSGYGYTKDGGDISKYLNYVYLRVIGNSECSAVYGNGVIISTSLCCKGYDFNTQSICVGDTGGPLILDDADRTIIGVGSFVSSRGCTAGDPSGYARVGEFLDWISSNTGIALRP